MPRYQKSAGFDRLNVSNLITTSSKSTVESLTAAATLDASDSGKVFSIDVAAGITITLPSPGAAGAGWSTKIVLGGVSPTGDSIINAPTDIISGLIVTPAHGAAAALTNVTPIGRITFDQSAGTAEGDYITLISDGTKFYVEGMTTVAVGIVFSTLP